MSNPHADHGGAQRHPTDAAPTYAGAQRQFAQGGNGSCNIAQPEPVPVALPIELDGQNPPMTDGLVMLQLASFEGRAV